MSTRIIETKPRRLGGPSRPTSAQSSNGSPWWVGMLPLVLLAYWPNAELIHDLWPQTVFGFSLWVTVLPTFTMVALFVTQAEMPRVVRLGISVMVVVVVLLARNAWGLNDVDRGLVMELVLVRYVFLFPLIVWLAMHACRQPLFRGLAPKVMGVNAAAACLVAITYALGVHGFRVAMNMDELGLIGEITRASGVMAGSNVFAHTVVAAILATQASRGLWSVALAPVLLFGLVVAQSRLAVAQGVLLYVYTSASARSQTGSARAVRLLAAFAAFAIIWIGSTKMGQLAPLEARFDQEAFMENSFRAAKNMLGLSAWASSPSTILLGSKDTALIVGNRPQDSFSDNSVVSALTSVGLLGTIPLLVEILWFVAPLFARREFIAPTLVLTTLFLNNAVLWDVWLFMVCSAVILWTTRSSQFEARVPWGSPRALGNVEHRRPRFAGLVKDPDRSEA